MAAVGRLALFPRRSLDMPHERAMEVDVRSLVREGVGQDWLGPEHAAAHRAPAGVVCGVVSDSAHGGIGCGAAHRLSWWRNIPVHSDGRAISRAGATDHGPVRVVWTVAAGGA